MAKTKLIATDAIYVWLVWLYMLFKCQNISLHVFKWIKVLFNDKIVVLRGEKLPTNFLDIN